MAERGALLIDKDQVVVVAAAAAAATLDNQRRRLLRADSREQALSELARRRSRRHKQMRRPMMAGLAEHEREQHSRRPQMTTTTTTTSGDHRFGPIGETSMRVPQTSRAQQQVLPAGTHDESDEIDAQLARLNELRLHDELSRSAGRNIATVAGQPTTTTTTTTTQTSAARMRMITSQAETLQQRQRAAELDNRLGGGGAGAVVVATTTAEYNRDQPPPPLPPSLPAQHHLQQSAAGQQQIPLLVDTNHQYSQQQHLDHLLPSHQNQYHQHHDQYNTTDSQQHQVAFYPHNLPQHQVGGGYLLEEPPDAPLTSLLDLDEGTHNQHRYLHGGDQQLARVAKQETVAAAVAAAGGRLPESVIRVNDWSERKLSSYDHEFYGNSSGSGCRAHSQAGQSAELTTLNSAAAASFDRSSQQPQLVHHQATGQQQQQQQPMHQPMHRRHDSTSSFNLSTNSTMSMHMGAGGSGSLAVTYGRELDGGYSSTTSALVGPSSQLLPAGAHNFYDDDDEDPDPDEDHRPDGDRRPRRSYGHPDRTRPRTGNRARASSSSSGHRRRQAPGTPANSDDADELKVCEWHGCGNSFLDMKDFVRHLEERHVNMEPVEKNRFFCMWTDCKRNNQEFNARYKLLIHMRVHSGEKPFTCDQSPYCKKSFSRLENLKIHKRSHTGEKPYRCNYEHCSKSFTNSSDRIKHHKTHKDPKPYTCTHDGCTKRYTDPSSLRKHLRAHKRHGDGPEVTDHGHLYSSSSAAHLYHSGHQDHQNQLIQPNHSQHQQHQELSFSASYQTAREHITPPQQQQQPVQSRQPVDNYAQQQQYPFDQQSYGAESYTTLDPHSKQMYDQQPTHQVYLQADYDPTKELESVLTGVPTITQQENQLNSSFKRPQQQQQQQPHPQHRTDLTTFEQSSQLEQQQQQQQQTRYLAVPPSQQHIVSVRSPSQQRFSEAQARQHERLSRSWCVGNSAARPSATARRQHFAFSGQARAPGSPMRLRLGGGADPSSQHPIQSYHIKQTPDFGPQAQDSQGWSAGPAGWPQQNHNQQAAPAMASREANFTQYTTPAYQMMQQQQHQSPIVANQPALEHWPPSSQYGEQGTVVDGRPAARTGQRVSFQFQFQQQQQQQQHQQSRQLSRQQQHEQLMRSMPANVNL